VRDEKMLEKLATYDVQDISELFSLVDKCARATEVHAWHSQPTPEAGNAGKPEADVAAQSNGKNRNRKKKKANGNNNNHNMPLASASTASAAAIVAGGGRGP
jgi:hypothetical protein